MNTTSDTPRTDEQQRLWRERIKGYEQFESIPDELFDFARQLERELADARNAEMLAAQRATAERVRANAAEDAYKNMREWAEKNGVDTVCRG